MASCRPQLLVALCCIKRVGPQLSISREKKNSSQGGAQMYKTCTFTVRTSRNVSILITKSCIHPNSNLEIQFDSKIVLRVKLIKYFILTEHQKLIIVEAKALKVLQFALP